MDHMGEVKKWGDCTGRGGGRRNEW